MDNALANNKYNDFIIYVYQDTNKKRSSRVRAYERSKLRYYYCIIDTDCIATAEHIYNECDGVELERTACK